MKLKDKVVVVTGASMGIGLEIAHALVREGCQVAFTARSLPRLQEEVGKAGGPGSAIAVKMDVTDEASVTRAIAEIERTFGRIDVVVNNAGNAGAMRLWRQSDTGTTSGMFDVHVLGTERVMRAVVPLMRRQGAGTIVNITSTLGFVAMPGTAAYNAAKAAVVMLSDTLRAELHPDGIEVRLFAPPHTSTEAGKAIPIRLPHVYEPRWVASRFVRFLKGRGARALPGGNESLLFLQRLWPSLAARIMRNIGFGGLSRLQLPGGTGS